MPKAEQGKFIRLFGCDEIRLTACAVAKGPDFNNIIGDYIFEPNQFWQRDTRHEKALMKVYRRNPKGTCSNSAQTIKIPMLFLGQNPADGWGELQFLIKEPKLVKLVRHRSFDTRVNKWAPETQLIQPKTDLETHSYLSLRFYHQDYLPSVPDDWHFEPVYVSIRNRSFYRVDVSWEEEEIKITVTALDDDSKEIPKHLLK